MNKESKIGRRNFMRVTGIALAGSAAGIGKAGTGPVFPRVGDDSQHVTFRETKRLPLSIDNPSALAVGRDGKIYAAGENAIVALDAEGKEIARHTVKGQPGCLAAFPDGKLLVGLRNHVEVLDSEKPGQTASHLSPFSPDLGERAYLTSIAAGEDGVFVADAGNRIVLNFDLNGTLRGRIGKRDRERETPGLVVPSPYFDVALDPMGALWVVNPGKHGLENYRPNGDLVSSWYRSGMDPDSFCGCCNPIHIAFRSDGSLVTAEKGLNRVKVYAPDTTLLGVVATAEGLQAPDTASLFCNVEPPVKDLAVDQQDRILVLHKPLKAILVFEQQPTGGAQPTSNKP